MHLRTYNYQSSPYFFLPPKKKKKVLPIWSKIFTLRFIEFMDPFFFLAALVNHILASVFYAHLVHFVVPQCGARSSKESLIGLSA